MTSEKQDTPVLESVDGWPEWDKRIRVQLRKNGYGDLLTRRAESSLTEDPADVEAWQIRQEIAVASVLDYVHDSVAGLVGEQATVKDLLDALKTQLKPNTNIAINALVGQLRDLLTNNSDLGRPVAPRLAQTLRNLNMELQQVEMDLKEEWLSALFLFLLGPDFAVFKTTILSKQTIKKIPGDTTEQIKFNDLCQQAHLHETVTQTSLPSRAAPAPAIEQNALLAKNRWNRAKIIERKERTALIEVPWCSHCDMTWHDIESCYEKNPKLKKEAEAKRAKRQKESISYNPNKSKQQKKASNENPEASLFAHYFDALLAAPNRQFHENHMVLDSGCSTHIFATRKFFINIKDTPPCVIGGVGDSTIVSTEIGTIRIFCDIHGKKQSLTIQNVRYCPDATVNLISVSQLIKRGARCIFLDTGHHHAEVQIRTGAVMTASHARGLYLVDLWDQPRGCLALAAYTLSSPEM